MIGLSERGIHGELETIHEQTFDECKIIHVHKISRLRSGK